MRQLFGHDLQAMVSMPVRGSAAWPTRLAAGMVLATMRVQAMEAIGK